MTERKKLIELVRDALRKGVCANCGKPAIGDGEGYAEECCERPVWDGASIEQQATAALTALEASGVRLVPVEATEDMLHFGMSCVRDPGPRGPAYDCWREMLAASPYAP